LRDQCLLIFRHGKQAVHFSMGPAEEPVVSLPDDLSLVDQYRTHHGIGRNSACTQLSEFEAAEHI